MKLHVYVHELADMPGEWVADCADLPELAGHGQDEDEAACDLIEQWMARVLH